VRVPTTPATVARSSWPTPSPPRRRHTTDDVDAHEAVAQLLSPTVAVGVVAATPKFNPDTVTLYPAVTAALASEEKLTTGAVHAAAAQSQTVRGQRPAIPA
jgi:hypothetical protein